MKKLFLLLLLLLPAICFAGSIRTYSDGVVPATSTGVKVIPTGTLAITSQGSVTKTVLRNHSTDYYTYLGQKIDRFDRPKCVQKADGTWAMVWREGTSHTVEAYATTQIAFLKTDGTWTAPNYYTDGDPVYGLPSQANSTGDALGPSESDIYLCPDGSLLIQSWDVNYNVTNDGTWQTKSTDGGKTWSSWSGPIRWVGQDENLDIDTFATEQSFIYDDVLYALARVYNYGLNPNSVGCKGIFVKTEDNGTTWEYVSDVCGWSFTDASKGCIEFSLQYLGADKLVVFMRDTLNYYTWITFSSNFGSTWDTPTRIDNGDLGANFYRVRTYTDSHLKGRANWWNDPYIICNGYSNATPGTSAPTRRSGIVLSNNQCTDLTSVQYVDNAFYDAGYGDLFYDSVNNKYGFVTYDGDSLESGDLVQYKFDVTW